MNVTLEGYSVEPLSLDDSDALQDLYERCLDYAQLMDGKPPSPAAARDEFTKKISP